MKSKALYTLALLLAVTTLPACVALPPPVDVSSPDITWLREVLYQSDDPLVVRVTGRAGSIFAITNFMRRLEASRFLRAVNTETIQEVASEADANDLVFMFELTLTYQSPPIDELETTPLFQDASAPAQTAGTGN